MTTKLCTRACAAACLICFFVACAPPVRQERLAAPISLGSSGGFLLTQDAACKISTGYSRILRNGTQWNQFGSIDRGDVYRSPDQVLTAEGYNVHEAYIVVKGEWLVGFYLPVEKTFTPVSKLVKLAIEKRNGE